MVHQRSSDMALALYWNITSAALFTHMLAASTGLEATGLVFNIANAHVYENHVNGVNRILASPTHQYPKIVIRKSIDIDKYEWEDINIIGYVAEKYFSVGKMAV